MVTSQKILEIGMDNRGSKSVVLNGDSIVKEQRVDGSGLYCYRIKVYSSLWWKLQSVFFQLKIIFKSFFFGFIFHLKDNYGKVLGNYKKNENMYNDGIAPKKISWLCGILLAVSVIKGVIFYIFNLFIIIYLSFIAIFFSTLDLIHNFFSNLNSGFLDSCFVLLLMVFFFFGPLIVRALMQPKDRCGYSQKIINSFYKYFGLKVFILNSLKLIGIGFLLYEFSSLYYYIKSLILLTFIIIVIWLFVKYIKKIKKEFIRLYGYYKINKLSILYLLLDRFLLWFSFLLTRHINLYLCWEFSVLFGNNLISFNFLFIILTSSLFDCLFFSNLLEPRSNLWIDSPSKSSDLYINIHSWAGAFCSLEPSHAERIHEFLARKLNISKMELLSRFDLSNKNLLTLVELLGLYSYSDNKYAFSFPSNNSRVTAVAEKNVKFWCPIVGNKVHLFEKKAGSFSEESLSSYFATRNCKSIFIYDPKNKLLFELSSKLQFVEVNEILYLSRNVGNTTGIIFDPYDPQLKTVYKNPDLFLRDKTGYYRKLDLIAEPRTKVGDNANISCSNKVSFIKTDINKEPVISKSSFNNNTISSTLLTVERLSKPAQETRFRIN